MWVVIIVSYKTCFLDFIQNVENQRDITLNIEWRHKWSLSHRWLKKK